MSDDNPIDRLSHQDKLRSIHFLLLAVAKMEVTVHHYFEADSEFLSISFCQDSIDPPNSTFGEDSGDRSPEIDAGDRSYFTSISAGLNSLDS